jgi:hypothetical protein
VRSSTRGAQSRAPRPEVPRQAAGLGAFLRPRAARGVARLVVCAGRGPCSAVPGQLAWILSADSPPSGSDGSTTARWFSLPGRTSMSELVPESLSSEYREVAECDTGLGDNPDRRFTRLSTLGLRDRRNHTWPHMSTEPRSIGGQVGPAVSRWPTRNAALIR